jgi:hypothetical protein
VGLGIVCVYCEVHLIPASCGFGGYEVAVWASGLYVCTVRCTSSQPLFIAAFSGSGGNVGSWVHSHALHVL